MPEPERIAGKRGMLPYRLGSIRFQFRDYLIKSKLPALPKSFGHVTNKPPNVAGGWNMYDNDRFGCCVCAGGEHEHMLFNMATQKPVPTFVGSNLRNYSAMLMDQNGEGLNPNDPSTDTGLDVEMAARFRRTTGLVDDQGRVHKILGYSLLRNVEELLIAAYCFGAAGWGFNIPDSAEEQFVHNHIWDDVRSPPSGGHYVPCMGRNSQGLVILNTWKNLQAATPDYITKRWSVGIAYYSPEYLMANNLSPELIDQNGLLEDLQAVGTA